VEHLVRFPFPPPDTLEKGTFSDALEECDSFPLDDWRHTGQTDNGSQEKFSNFFTNVRVHQIRQMQDQVSIDMGIPKFDFGDMWEGWQSRQQMVHPLKVNYISLSTVLRLCPFRY
jgi:hypothetical protein